jgi:hypothetical protein
VKKINVLRLGFLFLGLTLLTSNCLAESPGIPGMDFRPTGGAGDGSGGYVGQPPTQNMERPGGRHAAPAVLVDASPAQGETFANPVGDPATSAAEVADPAGGSFGGIEEDRDAGKPTGNVVFTSVPTGAVVTLEGREAKTAPRSFRMVDVGRYNVDFQLQDKSLHGDFAVIADSTVTVIADFNNDRIIERLGGGRRDALLQSYEANRIGFTFVGNDAVFMDFTVSLQYPFISKESMMATKANYRKDNYFYKRFLAEYLLPQPVLAFTGRFGQYVTRPSSPIIGKRFNPKLFLRFFTSDPGDSYLDIGFAHESNGQRIDSASSYQALRDEFASGEDGDPAFADNYVSRGWDYWEVVLFKNFNGKADNSGNGWATRVSLKYFLGYGPFQEEAEEYNSWEIDNPGLQRRQVDGITVSLHYKRSIKHMFKLAGALPIGAGGGAIIYTTGYKSAFAHNTLAVEYLFRLGPIPLLLWLGEGYNSDLGDYARRVRQGGICLDLATF